MKTRFDLICQLVLQHDYYSDNKCRNDFRVHPTPSCSRILKDHNFIFRENGAGFSMYGELDPDDSSKLLHAMGKDTKLTFWLELVNPLLLNITQIPGYIPGYKIFYCNNTVTTENDLQDHQVVELVTAPSYTWRFESGESEAKFEVRAFDADEEVLHTFSMRTRENESASEYRLDLTKIRKFSTGLYSITRKTREQGTENQRAIFFDRELLGKPVLCLVELELGSVQPSSTGNGKQYTLQFASRGTYWRYIVQKNTKTVSWDNLIIKNKAQPSARFELLPDGDNTAKKVFYSLGELPFQEKYGPVELHDNSSAPSKKLTVLPVPSMTTTLQQDNGKFYSDILRIYS